MPFYVYILRCSDDSYYTGYTTDVAARLYSQQSGDDPKAYTFSRRPLELVWVGEFQTHEEAFAFERQVKGWSRAKKEALIKEDWRMIHEIVREERKKREAKKREKD